MSGQRARPTVPADLRSAHPNIPGVPWWGAVLIGVVACAVGFAFDAGSGASQLTSVFSVFYVMGCLTAVLAVRRAGLFTAVIQPPLLLFFVVPGAYFLMHNADIHGIKDILINCGYPLIERFPLMFFTSAAVLLLGAARWYLGKSSSAPVSATADKPTGAWLAAKLSSLVGGGTANAGEPDREPKRRHSTERRAGSTVRAKADPAARRAARSGRPAKQTTATSRSRHARPPETELVEPVVDLDRPRRRRPRPTDEPAAEPRVESRRRSRPAASERRGGYQRPERFERERPQRSERPRAQRRPRHEDYDSYDIYDGYRGYEPPEPDRRAPGGTHHPVSRVRYRGGSDDADRWKFDI